MNRIERSILRWIHILFSIPILGYIYSPFDQLHFFAYKVRLFFVPVMALTGLWMWKGPAVRRLFVRRPVQQDSAATLAA